MSTWNNNAYHAMSGTSQAAAMASGVAALLVGLGLHGDEISQRLLATARDIAAPGLDSRTGAGLLDAARAVEGAAQGTIPAVVHATAAPRAASTKVRRHGLNIACDAAKPGTCQVKVRVNGTVVAKGKAPVDGTGAFDVMARPTAAGRRLLARGHALSGTIEAQLAGAASIRTRVALSAR
jgi:hypothetical protein